MSTYAKNANMSNIYLTPPTLQSTWTVVGGSRSRANSDLSLAVARRQAKSNKPSDSRNWRSKSATTSPATSPRSSPQLGPIEKPSRRRCLTYSNHKTNKTTTTTYNNNNKIDNYNNNNVDWTKHWEDTSSSLFLRTSSPQSNNYQDLHSKMKNISITNETSPVPKGTLPYGEGGPGGDLHLRAYEYFERAYGLNGYAVEDHKTLIATVQQEVGCSERAVKELLYGWSYSDLLEELREQIFLYPRKPIIVGNKNRCKEKRMAELDALAKILDPNQQQAST